MIDQKSLSRLILIGLVLFFFSFLAKSYADELPKSWTISFECWGGIQPRHRFFAVNSKGEIDPRSGMHVAGVESKLKLVLKKISDSDLKELTSILEKAYPFIKGEKVVEQNPNSNKCMDCAKCDYKLVINSGEEKYFGHGNPAVDALVNFFDGLCDKYFRMKSAWK